MTIEEMRSRKIELGLTNESLAEQSGVPLGTVRKILAGVTKAPRKATIEALERVLRKKESISYDMSPVKPPLVREPHPEEAYPLDVGEYTIDDYYALPDDVRMELIDGQFYDMGAPLNPHQVMVGELYAILRECVKKHGMPCIALVSPVDVQLDCDRKTMMQPDVMVLCGREKLKRNVVYGAPDFVIEVLSPSTRRKDLYLKLFKYDRAGVREYWIVDLDKKTVTCYDLEKKDAAVRLYTFRDRVPVAVSDGMCEVDFRELGQYLDELFPA